MSIALLIGLALSGSVAAEAQPPIRSVDPTLAEELRVAVEAMRPQLPIRADPITVTNITANGTELIYEMTVPTDLDRESIARFRQELPVQACADVQARRLFERGGVYTYLLRDPQGETFRVSIDRC